MGDVGLEAPSMDNTVSIAPSGREVERVVTAMLFDCRDCVPVV